ncbi:MAG: response regulator [Actinobacteria bacterium]|nr:response regulator [Actinomycetota bacterium]MCL5886684.1 response regulator [Actinomycetota bacterium]
MARILVVDDEPHILKLVSFSLVNAGHEVFEATDGALGVEAASEVKPDLILLDVMMPLMTGYQALELLKAEEDTAGIPVVMLSAKSQVYEQQEGLRLGAHQYVCKPFTPRDLVQVVDDILAGCERGVDCDG